MVRTRAVLTADGVVVFLVAPAVADGPRVAAVLNDVDSHVVVVHARGGRVDARVVRRVGARIVIIPRVLGGVARALAAVSSVVA